MSSRTATLIGISLVMGLGAVVGAHHQAVAEVGHRVLGQHPRLGVAQYKVHPDRVLAFEGGDFIGQRLDRRA